MPTIQDQYTPDTDDGFGPGFDLVLSVLGVLILVVGATTVTGLPKKPDPPPVPGDTHDMTDLTRQLALARMRIEELEAQKEPGNRRVVAFRFDGTNAAFFQRDKSDLTDLAQRLISGSLLTIGRKALEVGANQLEVTGYASPEPSVKEGRDSNLDLSSQRAEAVAHYLALRGIPYSCMSVRGVGRGRSHLLYDVYLTAAPDVAVTDWDALFEGERGRQFLLSRGKQLASERRVEIVVAHDSESKCKPEQLFKALGV